MKIEKNKWVAIHYTLKDESGKVLDSSVGAEPLGFLYGNGYLISGLERELEGKQAGDKFNAVIQPKDAYGEYDDRLILDVPRDKFEIDVPIEIGMQFQVMTPAGPSIVRVIKIDGDMIKIDGNHELAGKVLNFDVEVTEVRDATEEELASLNGNAGCANCNGDCGNGGCEGGGCGNCGK